MRWEQANVVRGRIVAGRGHGVGRNGATSQRCVHRERAKVVHGLLVAGSGDGRGTKKRGACDHVYTSFASGGV